MAQGLLKGVAVGALVSAGLVVVSSQILPPPGPGDLGRDFAASSPPISDVSDPADSTPDEGASPAVDAPAETAEPAVSVDTVARAQEGPDASTTPPATDPAEQSSDMAPSADPIEQGSSAQANQDTGEVTPEDAPMEQTTAAPDAAAEPIPDAGTTADTSVADTATDSAADSTDNATAVSADTTTADMEATGPSTDTPVADAAGNTVAEPVIDTAPPQDPAQQIAALSQPDDGTVPRLPGADARVLEPNGPVPPAAPSATTAPTGQATAPRAQPAETPSLAAPTDPRADAVAGQPRPEDIVLPVPESMPPTLPEPDSAPVQQDAPAALVVDEAEGDPILPATPPASNLPESVTIDGAPVDDAVGLDIQPLGDGAAGEVAPTVITPDRTGRDSVRVNRLAQITPPDPESDADSDVDAEAETDPEGAEDETTEASDAAAAADRPAEMDLDAEPEQDTSEGADADADAEAANAPPSSNLIERRLQAIARAADATDGATDPGDASSPPAAARPTVRRAAAPPESAASSASDAAMEPDPPADALTGVAIDDFDQPFDNPAGLPLVSVVLLDYGGPKIDLPLPLSIALDAGQANVAARAAEYRAAGYEVLIIPSLPQGATAQDVEQALQVNLDAVSGAVGLILDPASDVQDNRPAIETLVGRLSESGLGLVSFAQGLNRAQQIAAREDVPSGLVFREIDSEGQDLRAVKRFLDQAAFRARQESAVILVGRNRPETRGALMEWRLGNRAQSVALAPVTAAIRARAP